MSDQAQQQQDAGKEAKKVLQNFDTVVKKLTAIVQGEKNLKPVKSIPKDATATLVAELFKEEHEEIQKNVKEGLKNLLKGYVTLNNTLAAERKKLDAFEVAKKKEFNAEASKLFSQIEGLDSILQDYQGALTAAASEATATEEEEEQQ